MLGTEEKTIETQFVELASELNLVFPELDLRFSLKSESEEMRYYAAAVSDEILELTLGSKSTLELMYEATFALKELAQLFDA